MILSELETLMLSKTNNRTEFPSTLNMRERVFTALKAVASETIPLRLVTQDPTGVLVLRKVDEKTYIRFPTMPINDESQIDIDDYLLDAVALYTLSSIEKDKASIYMGMYNKIIEKNEQKLMETYLSFGSNESEFNDASQMFA